jgi:hypothetical protein
MLLEIEGKLTIQYEKSWVNRYLYEIISDYEEISNILVNVVYCLYRRDFYFHSRRFLDIC